MMLAEIKLQVDLPDGAGPEQARDAAVSAVEDLGVSVTSSASSMLQRRFSVWGVDTSTGEPFFKQVDAETEEEAREATASRDRIPAKIVDETPAGRVGSIKASKSREEEIRSS